jgi:hypothetical protein
VDRIYIRLKIKGIANKNNFMGIINRRAYRSEGREVISVKTLAYAKY